MGLFSKRATNIPTPKQVDKRIDKRLEQGNYATQDDITKVLQAEKDKERKEAIWNSMSPRLKIKLVKHVANRRAANAKRKGK